MKRRIVRLVQKYLVNPPMRAALKAGVLPPTHALLETTGRRSGEPRQNPVGNGLADDGRTFWIVAEHGRQAGYVRNIEADPRVRIRIGRRWRSGSARVVEGDDPRARLRAIARARRRSTLSAYTVRVMATDLTTLRVDLDGGVMPSGT